MRGVLSAGSLLALYLLGYRDCFDEVLATSAGSVNAAYFLSGQGALGIGVYFDCLSNRRFVNPGRFWKIVDVDFAYDEVVTRLRPLDEAAIRSGATDFHVSLTDVASASNRLVDVRAAPDPIARVLKASGALPVLYNRTVSLTDGRRYVDGGVTRTLPIREAVGHGCTDVLVLTTRPHLHRSQPISLVERLAFRVMMGARYPGMTTVYERRHEVSNADRELADGVATLPGVSVATICPGPAELVVGRTTRSRSKLVSAAHAMAAETARLLGEGSTEIDAQFEAFRHGSGPCAEA